MKNYRFIFSPLDPSRSTICGRLFGFTLFPALLLLDPEGTAALLLLAGVVVGAAVANVIKQSLTIFHSNFENFNFCA